VNLQLYSYDISYIGEDSTKKFFSLSWQTEIHCIDCVLIFKTGYRTYEEIQGV